VRILFETLGIRMSGLPIMTIGDLLRNLLRRGCYDNFTFDRQGRNNQNRVLVRHHGVCSKRLKPGFLSHEGR
jgi:hypothetical protein